MAHSKDVGVELMRTGSEPSPTPGDENEAIESSMLSGSVHSSRNLDKFITLKPAVGFGLTLLSSWEGLAQTMGAALLNGGPTVLTWGPVLAGVGFLAVAASLGELASITPVVGAQYRWTGLYAPRRANPAFCSLLQGWLTLIAWVFLCAQILFLIGTTIQGLIILNYPTYEPQRYHGTLLMWACLSVPFLFNVFARKALPTIEILGAIFHFAFFFITTISLGVMAEKSSAKFIFTESFYGQSGWDSKGVQWNLGLLSVTPLLVGFDGVLHLSDEIKDAPTKVPRAMLLSVGINALMAFIFAIVMLYCIGDVDAVTTSPTGFPFIQIYYQATKSKAFTTVLVSMVIINQTISVFSVYASVSRLAWAFAKDKGLPFSSVFARAHPRLRIPLNALTLITVISALLGLINLGNTTAFNATLSLTALGLTVSYMMPLYFIILRKLRGEHPDYGPFRLGRWGLFINFFALVYTHYIAIFLLLPSTLPFNEKSMNWAAPILVIVLIFALLDWFTTGSKRFEVPTSKTDYPGVVHAE